MNASQIVVLGSTEGLAFAELSALFPAATFTRLSGSCVLMHDGDVGLLRDIAGGVVKVASALPNIHDVTPQALADVLLSTHQDKPIIVFGISRYDGGTVDASLLHDIKIILEQQGKRARYVGSKGEELSSVVIQKQGVHEIIIARGDQGIVVGTTEGVQDFESWGKRDYGRPNADPKLGMLPPKVARMAVNIAIGMESDGKVILDPFCGMGTILAEGLMRGCRVIGSDISEDVVTKARKNLEWLSSQYPSIKTDYHLVISDATHVSSHIEPNSVDAIVTEPFMGTSALGEKKITDPTKIRGIVKGLEKLYIGALRDWAHVLKSGGNIVIALPKFEVKGRTYFVKKVVDNCENFGYTPIVGPIEYSRPQAVVKREFYIFQKK